MEKNINKTAILLVQAGSPTDTDETKILSYLKNILTDPRADNSKRSLWEKFYNYFILPNRLNKIMKEYKKMLSQFKSDELPFVENTRNLAEKIGAEHCFLYGSEPGPKNALLKIAENNFENIFVFPLHPQRSSMTVEAACYQVEEAYKALKSEGVALPEIKYFKNGFATENFYIDSLVKIIEKTCAKAIVPPKNIVFSFRGYPVKRIKDCEYYLTDCKATVRALCQKMPFQLKSHIAFQSRYYLTGKWIKPLTAQVVAKLGRKNASIIVVASGFICDNLETVVELDKRIRDSFENAGGRFWLRAPCLNFKSEWAEGLKSFILKQI